MEGNTAFNGSLSVQEGGREADVNSQCFGRRESSLSETGGRKVRFDEQYKFFSVRMAQFAGNFEAKAGDYGLALDGYVKRANTAAVALEFGSDGGNVNTTYKNG